MKKQRLKNYLKLGISLFGIAILIIACEKDNFTNEVNQEIINTAQPIIKTISFQQAGNKLTELTNTFQLNNHLDIISGNDAAIYQRSSETSTGAEFTIKTNVVKEISFNDYKSYTMFLEKQQSEDNKFYNITLQEKNGLESMFITIYIPTDYWLNNKTEPFEGQITTEGINTDLENPFEGVGSSGSYDPFIDDCSGTVNEYTIWVAYPCGCDNHWPWDICLGCSNAAGYAPQTVYECIPNTSPPDGSGSSNDNGGSSGSNNNDNPSDDNGQDDMTVLITDDEVTEQEVANPCQALAKLTQTDSLSANIKPIVDSLRLKTNKTVEWYTNFRNSEDSDYDGNVTTTTYQEQGITASSSIKDAPASVGPSFFGQIHTHPNSRANMFSWLDLRAIKLVYEGVYSAYRNDVFIMIVCSNGEVYSLKVNDITALNTALDADLAKAKGNNYDEKKENIKEFLKTEYAKSSNLEQTFLKLYGNHGISLYKATDTNLSNWEKLELDANDDEIVLPTPC